MSPRAALLAAALAFAAAPAAAQESMTAIFAGGCFWCVEADFDKVEGVTRTISGFAGGDVENPTYRQVTGGGTGHREAVEVTYDPAVVGYETLLDVFWHAVDPTDAGGQFCDRGDIYTTAVFVQDDTQDEAARRSKQAIEEKLGRPVATTIERVERFWPADAYHQDYYKSEDRILSRFGWVTKAQAYKAYRDGCGRDARLKQVWGADAMRGIK